MLQRMLTQCVIIFIRIYQLSQPLLRGIFTAFGGFQSQCFYAESCSHYSIRILNEKSLFKAIQLIAKRLSSCIGYKKPISSKGNLWMRAQ